MTHTAAAGDLLAGQAASALGAALQTVGIPLQTLEALLQARLEAEFGPAAIGDEVPDPHISIAEAERHLVERVIGSGPGVA